MPRFFWFERFAEFQVSESGVSVIVVLEEVALLVLKNGILFAFAFAGWEFATIPRLDLQWCVQTENANHCESGKLQLKRRSDLPNLEPGVVAQDRFRQT
jgi:hypothetical protein